MLSSADSIGKIVVLAPLLAAFSGCGSTTPDAASGDTDDVSGVDDRPEGDGEATDSDRPPGQGDGNSDGAGDDSSGDAGAGSDPAVEPGSNDADPPPSGNDPLRGYWVWESRVFGDVPQSGPVDAGQMKVAFGTGNDRCHYLWNETTGSDFHTGCTYRVAGDMVTFQAAVRPDGLTEGYSCAHPDWSTWNDRPAVQWGRYRLDGDHLWLGVNTYWGFGGGVGGVPGNGSLKRFPFWESEGQATTEEAWIVFRRVTREEWFTTYAISTRCQGTPELCATLPGCGSGDHPYVD